jgi:hypothetical protein
MNKKELWLRLRYYHFDHLVTANLLEFIQEKFGGTDASTKAFAHKLARKLGWSNAFATRAVEEYKKFVYLGVVSEFVVTPSEIIDQVWHQHLLFSKAYRSFCTDVIEYDFDHNPELVSVDEQTGTFNAQYLDTLKLYKKEFGVEPPHQIWSVPKFDEQALPDKTYSSKKKRILLADGSTYNSYDNTPLVTCFDAGDTKSLAEFGGYGSGDGGGAGAGSSWDDINNDSSGNDSSGDSSSDSGSSCSSCSSGCGGGGGD